MPDTLNMRRRTHCPSTSSKMEWSPLPAARERQFLKSRHERRSPLPVRFARVFDQRDRPRSDSGGVSGSGNEFERGERFPGQAIDGQDSLGTGGKFKEQRQPTVIRSDGHHPGTRRQGDSAVSVVSGRRGVADPVENTGNEDARRYDDENTEPDDDGFDHGLGAFHSGSRQEFWGYGGVTMGIREHTVTAEEAGNRIDRVLARVFADLSRTRIKALIQKGCLTSGGRTVTETSLGVKPGDRLVLEVPRPAEPALVGEDIPLVIVHEDEHLLVVDKPAGLVVHPGAGHASGTLVNALLSHCGNSLSGIGGEARPGIVHRLDKDTSGLMVVAKTDDAHVRLSAALSARRVTRGYAALVRGRMLPPAGKITGAIGRDPRHRKRMAVVQAGGKPALTHYETQRNWGHSATLLRCSLATGRTHQIRVHVASKGHPVLGDTLYGETSGRMARQALHAASLGFHHPATDDYHEYSSGLPEDIRTLITHLDNTLETRQ